MNEVAAIEKARSLYRFAMREGAPLSEFLLILTDQEALDLLEPLKRGDLGHFAEHDQLEIDIEEAVRHRNPWSVLEHFQLEGLDICRARERLQ